MREHVYIHMLLLLRTKWMTIGTPVVNNNKWSIQYSSFTVVASWFHDTVAARLVVGLFPLQVRWNGTRFQTLSRTLLRVPTVSKIGSLDCHYFAVLTYDWRHCVMHSYHMRRALLLWYFNKYTLKKNFATKTNMNYNKNVFNSNNKMMLHRCEHMTATTTTTTF